MSQREKVILELDDRLSKETKTAAGNMDKLKTAVKGVAAAAALQQLGKFAADTVTLAVAAEEAGAAFDTTFGMAVDDASQFVDEFANKAGFATFELEQMLAVTGNVVQGIGATEEHSLRLSQAMATLAGDVASFSNAQGGAAAVMGALQSAINGEREALKTYGLAVSEAEVVTRALADTGKTSAEQLTRLEKAEATLAVAAEKAGKALGDLDRTQGSTANSMRRLSAEWTEAKVEIGDGLIPVLQALIPIMGAAASGMGAAGRGIQNTVSGIHQSVFNLRTMFGSLPGEVGKAEAELRRVIRTMDEGTPATEAIAQGFANLDQATDLTQISMTKFRDDLGLTNGQILDAIDYTLEHAIANGISKDAIRELIDAQMTLSRAEMVGSGTNEEYAESFTAAYEAQGLFAKSVAAAAVPIDKEAAAAAELEQQMTRAATATNNLRQANELLAEDLRAQADPVFNLIREWDTLQTVLGDGEASLFDIAEANLDVQAAMDGLSPGNLVKALDAIAVGADTDREAVRLLLEEMGILDGLYVTPVIDIQVRGATRLNVGGAELFNIGGALAAASGGLLDFPAGTPVPLTAHGQERILSAEQNRIFEDLAQAVTAGGGDTFNDHSNYSPRTTLQIYVDGEQTTEASVDSILDRAELAGILSGSIGGIA